MLTVVAALIESKGKLLVCQRRRDDRFGLFWEFPGGKVRSGETPQQALARELKEELGAEAEIGREIYRTHYRYQEIKAPLELIFFAARLDAAKARNLAFEQIAWREPATLRELNFLPADGELVDLLGRGQLSPGGMGWSTSRRLRVR